MLAYVRTALALGLSGASALHFFAGPASNALGWLLIALGSACFGIGCVRFLTPRRKLRA